MLHEHIFRMLLAEIFARRNFVLVLFVIISLICLYLGTVWPKKYTSTSIIQIDNSNILQPLMRGAAETTDTIDKVANAREIIFGEKIMDQLLQSTDLIQSDSNDVEVERLKRSIKQNVTVSGIGDNLLKIAYWSDDSDKSYLIVKNLAELFIAEGEQAKVNESQSAFSFIEKQVNEYLQKLTDIEEGLKDFRSKFPEMRPELEQQVAQRITRLQQEIEEATLLLSEASTRKASMTKQLSGEAAILISQSRESQHRQKITELTASLEALRLEYKETYPDIVSLKQQISETKRVMTEEIDSRNRFKDQYEKTGRIYIDESTLNNPLFQQLRSSLSTIETEIVTLSTRIKELNYLLSLEYEKSKKIQRGVVMRSNLTRNYSVNQEIYQDLLRRLENARVSRNLDLDQKGLTYKLLEPAKVALLPTGMRFIHFLMMGIGLGILIPVGLVYLLIELDTRVRFAKTIEEELGIPVLAEIDAITNSSDSAKISKSLILIAVVVFSVFSVYGYAIWLKFIG